MVYNILELIKNYQKTAFQHQLRENIVFLPERIKQQQVSILDSGRYKFQKFCLTLLLLSFAANSSSKKKAYSSRIYLEFYLKKLYLSDELFAAKVGNNKPKR